MIEETTGLITDEAAKEVEAISIPLDPIEMLKLLFRKEKLISSFQSYPTKLNRKIWNYN